MDSNGNNFGALNDRLTALEAKIAENNTLIKSLRNIQRLNAWLKALYWTVIIIAGFVSYGVVKPYLGELNSLYELIPGTSAAALKNSQAMLGYTRQ